MLNQDSKPNVGGKEESAANSFWHSPTLDALADAQGVKPVADIRVLFGTWPGEADDGFEATIDALRHPNVLRG